MLRPVLICRKKGEQSVKLLCDTLLDSCPSLAQHLKVLCADGENGILNETCYAFPFALLLLCIRHIEENVRRSLPKNMTETRKEEVLKIILGNSIIKGIVDCEYMEEYEEKIAQFYEVLSLDKGLIKYFKTFKVVEACQLNEKSSKFYNNSVESMNKLIKIGSSIKR